DVPDSDPPGGAEDFGDDAGPGSGGGGGFGSGGGGRRGNNSGDDDKRSPDPRAAILDSAGTDSNGSTSTHTSSPVPGRGRGLAANLGDSPSMLLDSRGSSDHIGSSIFSSTESKGSPSKDVLHQSAPTQMNTRAEARPDPDSDRKKRFRELANRRKSGTLERISNRGFVKSRKALLTSSDSNVQLPPQSSGRLPARSRKPKAQLASSDSGPSSTDSKGAAHASGSRLKPRSRAEPRNNEQVLAASDDGTTKSSFLGLRGEEQTRSRDSGVAAAARSANVNMAPIGVEVPLSRSHAALPPSSEQANVSQNDDPANVEEGKHLGLSASAASFLEQPLRVVQPESEGGAILLSRGSSGGRSGAGSGSGEDSSLHILSSLDTLSTPESTPLDSAPENTNVGLLAQYNMNPKRFERRMKVRSSSEEKHSYFSSDKGQQERSETEQPIPGTSDVELGFRTINDTEDDPYAMEPEQSQQAGALDVHGSALSAEDHPGSSADNVGFHTLMPTRPRYNTKALF
ncbi:hypothetical protein GGI22_007026, partial [Coemansia erecta]